MSQPTLMSLEKRIYTIRGMQVMLDSELAEIYQVETKVFNQAVKRNKERFPESFRFQLTEAEYSFLRSQFSTLNDATDLRSQIATSSSQDSLRSQTVTLENGRGKHRKYLPYVFTEQGVAMLSAVLNSQTAIQTSIQIINAFVSMRQFFAHNANLFNRLDMVEKRQLGHEAKTDEKIVYHIGASLKDLGKKWFAFSKMEMSAVQMLARVTL